MPPKKSTPKTIRITEFTGPNALEFFIGSNIVALYAAGLVAPYIVPGTQAWDLLKEYSPVEPAKALWYITVIAAVTAAAHLFEALLFDQLRMRKYGVPRLSGLWWKWEISCFIEGIGAWKRIGKAIAIKEKQAGGRK